MAALSDWSPSVPGPVGPSQLENIYDRSRMRELENSESATVGFKHGVIHQALTIYLDDAKYFVVFSVSAVAINHKLSSQRSLNPIVLLNRPMRVWHITLTRIPAAKPLERAGSRIATTTDPHKILRSDHCAGTASSTSL